MSSVQIVENESTDDISFAPCLFSWAEGGNEVYLIGSFINWDLNKKIPMKKINGEFIVILLLTKDVHTYRFIVDGKEKCSSSTTVIKGTTGEMHNIINVKTYIPFNFELKKKSSPMSYEKIWRHIALNTLDCAATIVPIPMYLENSRNIIHQNVNGPSPISEPLCNHMYFDTETYREQNSNIAEICVVHLSQHMDNMGWKKKIFTKYNILTNMNISKSKDDNKTSQVESDVEKVKLEINSKEEHATNSEKKLQASNPLKRFISLS